jgi:hypothetical protein
MYYVITKMAIFDYVQFSTENNQKGDGGQKTSNLNYVICIKSFSYVSLHLSTFRLLINVHARFMIVHIFFHPKGQLISKGNFGVFNSSKKQT